MPTKHFTAFISYSHSDGEQLALELQQKIASDEKGKNITFWQDHNQMKYGQWSRQIEDAINAVEFLIMLITPGALASPNCKDEWIYARKNGVVIIPVNGKPDDPQFFNSFPGWLKKENIYSPQKNWERFINDLNGRPEALKVPFMAPRLSEVVYYVKRPGKLFTLKNLLLNGDEPVAITTALQGSGGFGKTTIAIALCNDDDIIHSFYDGILWVTLGQQKGTALTALQKLYDAVSIDKKAFLDLEQAQQTVREKFLGKKCLLVIDDAWHRVDAENIIAATGGCAVLITTRMDKLTLNAKQEHVDEMSEGEAVQLLSNYSGIENANNQLNALARALGYWALLLKLVGAQLKGRIIEGEGSVDALLYVNRKLEKKGLTGFNMSDAEKRNESVDICLAASIELLEPGEITKLYSLGIFPEDQDIPFQVLEKYWEIDDFDCGEFVEKLHRLGLVDINLPDKTLSMHDVLLRYYGGCIKDKPSQHAKLFKQLGSYNSWQTPYAWLWGISHLKAAGQLEEAVNLLTDYHWISGKLKTIGSVYEICKDYDLIPGKDELKLIQKALYLSAAILEEDPFQLPQQMYGRLALVKNEYCRNIAKQALDATTEYRMSLKLLNPTLELPDLQNLVLRGHVNSVSGAILQSDLLISWSYDWTLRSWDLKTGKQRHVFEGHTGSVSGALLQGVTLISWSDDETLRSWDIQTGKQRHIFEGHNNSVSGAILQGDALISWSYDRTLRSWDVHTGKQLHVFERHAYQVHGAILQGALLISWSHDTTLRSWDFETGEQRHVFEGHTYEVFETILQGEVLISWSAEKVLRSWDLQTGKQRHVFKGHQDNVHGAILQGNKLISWSNDRTLRSWDIQTGKQCHIFEGHTLSVTGAIVQGNTLISWSFDKTLRSWDIQTGKQRHVFEGHTGGVYGAILQGDTLISWSESGDTTLRSWDVQTGKQRHVFEGHTDRVSGALLQGDTLISWSDDRTLRSWNVQTGKQRPVFEGHTGGIFDITLHKDALISWSKDKTLRSWDLKTGTQRYVFEGHTDRVFGSIIQADELITWSLDKTLRSWDLQTGKQRYVFEGHTDRVYGAILRGGELISWSFDKTLRSWDAQTGKQHHVFKGHTRSVYGAILHGNSLISWDGENLRSWDVQTGKLRHVFEGHTGIYGAIMEEHALISWSYDRTLQSWDLQTGKQRRIFEGHIDRVCGALLQGETLISWSDDRTLRSWDIHTGKQRHVFKGHTHRVSGAILREDELVSWSQNEILIWSLDSISVLRILDNTTKYVNVLHEFLFSIDFNNTLEVYHFSSFEYITRFKTDADITTLDLSPETNRIILGDASGRIHFLEPVGFHV